MKKKYVTSVIFVLFIFISSFIILSCDYYLDGLIDDWSLIGPEGSITVRIDGMNYGEYEGYNAYMLAFLEPADINNDDPVGYGKITIEKEVGAGIIKYNGKPVIFSADDNVKIIVWIDFDESGNSNFPEDGDLSYTFNTSISDVTRPQEEYIDINSFNDHQEGSSKISVVYNDTSYGDMITYLEDLNGNVLSVKQLPTPYNQEYMTFTDDLSGDTLYFPEGTTLKVHFVVKSTGTYNGTNYEPVSGDDYAVKTITTQGNETVVTFNSSELNPYGGSAAIVIETGAAMSGNTMECYVGDGNLTTDDLYYNGMATGEAVIDLTVPSASVDVVDIDTMDIAYFGENTTVSIACAIDVGYNGYPLDYYDRIMDYPIEVTMASGENIVTIDDVDINNTKSPIESSVKARIENIPGTVDTGAFTFSANYVTESALPPEYEYASFDLINSGVLEITLPVTFIGDTLNFFVVYKYDSTQWDGSYATLTADDKIWWQYGNFISDDHDGILDSNTVINVDYDSMISGTDPAVNTELQRGPGEVVIELYNAFAFEGMDLRVELYDDLSNLLAYDPDPSMVSAGYVRFDNITTDGTTIFSADAATLSVYVKIYYDADSSDSLSTGDLYCDLGGMTSLYDMTPNYIMLDALSYSIVEY